MIIDEDLRELSKLSAGELAERLREHFNAIGGLVGKSDVEIARELVRKARRGEQAEVRLRQLDQASQRRFCSESVPGRWPARQTQLFSLQKRPLGHTDRMPGALAAM